MRAQSIIGDRGVADSIRMVYLPASRNPLDDLARREAQTLIELLRAQQQRIDGTKNLRDLRGRATGLLEALTQHGIIADIETRIANHLHALTAGVTRQTPHIRAQVVDDTYLARVLEIMLATLEGRDNAQPLEVTGLGYVNLLHIAVTLAAIPDPTAIPVVSTTEGGPGPAPTNPSNPDEAAAARAILEDAHEVAEMQEDSFYPDGPFHAIVVIEEPEAHLHPQLQFALVRYLRQVVRERPEIQVVITSHANDIISACEPDDLVLLRRRGDHRVSVALKDLPLTPDHKRKVRLHMDASRSSALFAERLLLVEGVTEVALIRQLAYLWAANDAEKRAFVDALTIVAMGTKVGEWGPALLATRGKELCTKLAVLRDSDLEEHETPSLPSWASKYDPNIVQFFHSHPTLEPAVTPGNEELITAVLLDMEGWDAESPTMDSTQVHELFRSAKKAKGDRPAQPAGPMQSRKGEFALELADELLLASETDARDAEAFRAERGYAPPVVPAHLAGILEFLYPQPPIEPLSGPEPDDASNDAGPTEPAAGAGNDGSD
ncbi:MULTISPECIES: ATP-dependent nuclease [unclassified Isoptericola]|uniref:ATP-dependent nuclease n=1 Tax=unclassified Isoptericola TaxID=2623355 RepID=UPI003657D740